MNELENKVKLAGLAFYADYGKSFFNNEADAIEFVKFNLNKGYMSIGFIETCAKLQVEGGPFMFGDMPGKFYDEWQAHKKLDS